MDVKASTLSSASFIIDKWMAKHADRYVWSTGIMIAKVIEDIFTDGVLVGSQRIHTVSNIVRGFYGVKESVFLSLPCYIARTGVQGWLPLELNAKEEASIHEAVKNVLNIQNNLLIYRK
jgi:malate/lactate dehydrogenase